MLDSTQRFARVVENYVRYRPSYPPAVLETLQRECGLTPQSEIADIGSGTGILTAIFLRNGNTVYGIEPNREMRAAGEKFLREFPRFTSIDGTAEATTLEANSVDFITAGQAFHWFDKAQARREFLRILKPGGWVALVWNERRRDSMPFLREYEEMLRRYSTDYQIVTQRDADARELDDLFGHSEWKTFTCENSQRFDYESLRGRLFSSSYCPTPGDPHYEKIVEELRRIFHTYQQDGHVVFEYDTELYYGQMRD